MPGMDIQKSEVTWNQKQKNSVRFMFTYAGPVLLEFPLLNKGGAFNAGRTP
ncbi:hypothetical protein MJ581_08525 [Escherichia coli]|nr:hypothetical protein MJ581_08525 [Escherichia coli]